MTLPPTTLYVALPAAGLACGLLAGLLIRKRPTVEQAKDPLDPSASAGLWSKWAMDNSDKFLLAFMMMILLGLTIHVIHDNNDGAQTQFFNGLTNTFSGALITLVTGSVLRKTTAATVTKDPDTGKATGVTTVKDEEK